MKVAVVCLLVVVIAAVSVEGANQTRIIGYVRPGDRLLDRNVMVKPGRPGVVTVSNYQYPKFGGGGIISCIKVLDNWQNGANGDLYINRGGVGQRSVGLSIRSKLGFGHSYDVQVWGR